MSLLADVDIDITAQLGCLKNVDLFSRGYSIDFKRFEELMFTLQVILH
jgi:hypothetical protein